MKKVTQENNSGFTLIELAVVLVIIGFLIGGIVAGQSLLRQSRISSVLSDANKYLSAVERFDTKYQALPGDINGSAYWSGSYVGDEDGVICDDRAGFFQHLSMAQLIRGEYLDSTTAEIEVSAPVTELKGATFWIGNSTPDEFVGGSVNPSCGTATSDFIYFGKINGDEPIGSVFTPLEAYMIDIKSDDGLPDSGVILGGSGDWTVDTCTSGSSPDFLYDQQNQDEDCRTAFLIDR